MSKNRSAILMGLLAILLMLGCSHSGINPVEPLDSPDEPAINKTPDSQRVLWGVWNISFDPVEFKVTVEPARNALAHFNITDWLLPPACDDCLKIKVNSFDPVMRILDADVTLRNPTHLSGHDVRGILYTNEYGHLLKNADAWTDLWDIPGGEDINPFKAFAKAEPNRIFEPDAEHTENYLIYIPSPPNWNQITFAVDASWPNNCREPYDITNFYQQSVYDVEGSSGIVQVDIFDWQGDVSEVILELPEITGVDETPLIHMSGNTWSSELINTTGAFAGNYVAKITARSANSGTLALYNYVEINISEQNIEFNPVEATPYELALNPSNMVIEGDYLYVVSNTFTYEALDKTGGLHIYDISDPVNPVPVNSVFTVWEDEEYLPVDLVIADGYAYLACEGSSVFGLLMIIDIEPVEAASILTAVKIYDEQQDVDVADGYAYVVGYNGLYVVDVHQPDSPFVIGNTYPGGDEVIVSGDFAYVSSCSGLFSILNVSDPENPILVNSVEFGEQNWSFSISNGYAYVVYHYWSSWDGGLAIVDIDPPEEMSVINNINIFAAYDIDINNGYAYIAQFALSGHMSVVDIAQPGSEHVICELHISDTGHTGCQGVVVSENYAYVATRAWGISVVDISNPVSPELLNTVYTLNYARKISISDGYAYILDSFLNNPREPFGIDVDPLDSMKTLFPICPYCWANDVIAYGGYAFLAANGLAIVDVDPIENAYTVTTVDISSHISYDWARNAMAIDDGYLFLAGGVYDEVQIVDIDPVEEAHLAHVITGVDKPHAVAVVDDYAYVCGYEFYIIDVAPIESPEIVKTLPVKGVDMAVSSGHAFIVDDEELIIIDVNPPDSAHIILSISDPDYEFYSIKITGGYAYVNDFKYYYKGSLRIFDISPPVTAHLVETIELPAGPVDFEIYNNRAYICCGYKGVRVYELW